MNSFLILLEQVKLFTVYIIMGVVLVKMRVLDSERLEGISRFVLKMALPLLIFTNTVNGVSKQQLNASMPVLLCSITAYTLLFVLMLLMVKVFCLPQEHKNLYRALGMFGNIGFMGIPILTSLFPENGIVYIGIVTIVDQFLLWTIGVQLITGENRDIGSPVWRKMINPVVIAVLVSIIFVITGWKLPIFINKAFTNVGGTSTSLALIYLGGVFASMSLPDCVRKIEFYGIALVKMLMFPIAFFSLLGLFPITRELRVTMALLTGMPSMSSLVMMAGKNDLRGEYMAGGVFVTTLLSLITLPVVCWIIQ